jgi:hypothetical protein
MAQEARQALRVLLVRTAEMVQQVKEARQALLVLLARTAEMAQQELRVRME